MEYMHFFLYSQTQPTSLSLSLSTILTHPPLQLPPSCCLPHRTASESRKKHHSEQWISNPMEMEKLSDYRICISSYLPKPSPLLPLYNSHSSPTPTTSIALPPPPHCIRVEKEAPFCGVDLRSGGDGEALRLHVQWGVHDIVEQADAEQIHGADSWKFTAGGNERVQGDQHHASVGCEREYCVGVLERMVDELPLVEEKRKKLQSSVEIVII
ncbi:hypothetical protein SASPL_114889 [Salvia splendens]|uniref:Uncharacterized protein n=1 Tax=Salvia splendens TaxID=180675 RepID=A0A8X8Y7B6_SALSN|nr:hypothetical protein SASPL_114889 [Salvia splendens]